MTVLKPVGGQQLLRDQVIWSYCRTPSLITHFSGQQYSVAAHGRFVADVSRVRAVRGLIIRQYRCSAVLIRAGNAIPTVLG